MKHSTFFEFMKGHEVVLFLNPKSKFQIPKSCLNLVFVQAVIMVFFWASAGASPIGYSYTEEEISRQDDSLSKPSFRFDPKSWLDVDIWIRVDPDDIFSGNLFDSVDENKVATLPVTAYLFSYSAYLQEGEFPFFETWTRQGLVVERPFEYKGTLPVPGYASGPEGGTFAYPHEQLAPKVPTGPAAPASSGPRYSSLGAGPQEGETRGGAPYKYDAPLGREKSGIDELRQEVAVSRTEGKPYGMILLGAGLTALAALFRMFRLSLFIMVGWLVFYGRDIWRIIVDLV